MKRSSTPPVILTVSNADVTVQRARMLRHGPEAKSAHEAQAIGRGRQGEEIRALIGKLLKPDDDAGDALGGDRG